MALRMRIKELIKEKSIRDGKRVFASNVAAAIGVSHNTIAAYIDNAVWRPDLRTLDKLQDYFECSIEDLFEKVDEETLEAERRQARTFSY
jgi:DNA-binding XRE family transcriptional regulator